MNLGSSTNNDSKTAVSSDVFHSHSYNLPHLNTWIDEIIKLTDKTTSGRKANTNTEDLVDSLHRYDAIFRELIRQTNIFSGELTKLYGKLWVGVLKLLDAMIKIYHRHVTQTSSLQDQARELIRQRHAQVAATKIEKEQGTLERTALRANIRNLDAEILALKTSNRELDRENRGLRLLVDTYIDGRDFDPSGLKLVAADMDSDLNMAKKKKTLVESFQHQSKLVSSLDMQMNESLMSIEKEDDRQKTIISQLSSLLERNKGLILAYKLQHEDRSSICGGLEEAPLMVDCAIQVDEKQAYSLVIDEDSEDESEDALSTSIPKFLPGTPNAKDIRIKGPLIPYQIRKYMNIFSEVLRVPSLQWTCQTIFNIYMAKAQHDLRFQKMLLCSDKKTLGEFVYQYYLEKFGLPAVADSNVMLFLRACELHSPKHRRVQLFCDQLGLLHPEEDPALGMRDTDFVLQVLRLLRSHDEFKPLDLSKGGDQLDLTSLVQPHIRRTSALATGKAICDEWGLEGSTEYLLKIRAMPNAKGSFYVDLDEFLEISVEQWVLVRTCWASHLTFLFQYNSTLFKVQSEAHFGVEGHHGDKDAVLAQVTKETSGPGAGVGSRATPRLLQEAAEAAARCIAQREKFLRPQLQHHTSRPATSTSSGQSTADDLGDPPSSSRGAGGGDTARVDSAQQLSKGSSSINTSGTSSSSTQSKSAGGAQSNLVQLIPLKKFYLMMRMMKPRIKNEEVCVPQVTCYVDNCLETLICVLNGIVSELTNLSVFFSFFLALPPACLLACRSRCTTRRVASAAWTSSGETWAACGSAAWACSTMARTPWSTFPTTTAAPRGTHSGSCPSASRPSTPRISRSTPSCTSCSSTRS
jgi:hypothetical protein